MITGTVELSAQDNFGCFALQPLQTVSEMSREVRPNNARVFKSRTHVHLVESTKGGCIKGRAEPLKDAEKWRHLCQDASFNMCCPLQVGRKDHTQVSVGVDIVQLCSMKAELCCISVNAPGVSIMAVFLGFILSLHCCNQVAVVLTGACRPVTALSALVEHVSSANWSQTVSGQVTDSGRSLV